VEQETKLEFFGGGWRQVDTTEEGERSKVIDVHSHIFRRFGTGSGPESGRLALKLWQYHVRDFTDFWRKSDGKRINAALLEFPSDDINEMPDVNFRMGRYGQAEVTIDGVDYAMQLYPPALENLEATPERMVAEMEVAGVDIGVLQSDHVYGANISDYYAEAMERFPGRFIPLAQIRETEADQPAQLERLERAVGEQGCRGLYFSVELFSFDGYVDHIDDAKFEPLWSLVRQLDVPVFWYLDPRKQDRVASFLSCIAEANRWAEAHPDIPAVLTHGPVPAAIIHRIGIPDELWKLLKRPNMHVEMIMQAKFPEYPFPEGQEMLRQFRDEVGIEKLMWGSDMPFGTMWCTYKQAVDYVRLHCDFFSREEKDLFLGGNIARVVGIPAV
jgi:predicted TIM-barrel fold metal-dependent hydrolase